MAHLELADQPAGPLLELYGAKKRFTIPFGLKTLLEDMTRELLRYNPTNIYGFLADYLDDRLASREVDDIRSGKGKHSWEWRRWSWDGSSLLSKAELIAFLSQFKISVEIAQHLATIIQAAYRGFMGRKEYHHKQEEHEHRRASLWDEWRHEGNLFVSAKDVQDILAYYGISLFEANAFATKIQSVFRGYFQRRSLLLADPELAAHLQQLGITHRQADRHATTIQSLFRGFKARKAKAAAEAAAAGKALADESYFDNLESNEEKEAFLRMLSAEEEEIDSGVLKFDTDTSEREPEEADINIAASKIQAGFRGMKARKQVKEMRANMQNPDYDESGAEDNVGPDSTVDKTVEVTREKKPKYDAYFPGGYDEKKHPPGTSEAEQIPPKFTHEHFGDIDPLALKKKFSDHQFREKMSFVLKDLNETKNERLKEYLVTRRDLAKENKSNIPIKARSAQNINTEQKPPAEESPKNISPFLLGPPVHVHGHVPVPDTGTDTGGKQPLGFLDKIKAGGGGKLPVVSSDPEKIDKK